ncbi:hypothetical protein DER46DRAFT_654598 [Fusarium sp. MPI-SDFR-AT-0072]|nr:hypothetical protein DER46DRAFT_654598 [Fusarium sp. MPI-SDFR-AT-0072]
MAAPPAVKDDEIAKHHLTLHSKYFPGKFHRAFPGPQASVPQRRQYKYAFCKWYHGPEDFEVTKSRVCRLEKDLAAEVLIKRPEHREMKVSLFEWSVDSMFWGLWFIELPQNKRPMCPRDNPRRAQVVEGSSEVFARLEAEYYRKGFLVERGALEKLKQSLAAKGAVSSQLLTAPTPHSSPRLINMDKEDLRKTLNATQTK